MTMKIASYDNNKLGINHTDCQNGYWTIVPMLMKMTKLEYNFFFYEHLEYNIWYYFSFVANLNLIKMNERRRIYDEEIVRTLCNDFLNSCWRRPIRLVHSSLGQLKRAHQSSYCHYFTLLVDLVSSTQNLFSPSKNYEGQSLST